MPDDTFAHLLDAARAGDEFALAELYRSHNPRLLRFLRAQVPDDAEDLGSETWIAAARTLRGFSGDEDQFRGWLYTIARRRIIDHRRRTGRRVPATATAPESVPAPTVSSAEHQAMEGKLGDDAARRIVSLLSPEDAEIVLLRVVADLPVEQVAAIIGRSPGAVRVQQHRALRRLAKILSDGTQREGITER